MGIFKSHFQIEEQAERKHVETEGKHKEKSVSNITVNCIWVTHFSHVLAMLFGKMTCTTQ